MARRVALARAIVMDPEMLIYDEPFVGLDPISMGVIVRLIEQMNEALGITSIVVSHDVQELAQHRATTATCCRAARSSRAGTPEELHAERSRSRAAVHERPGGRAGAVSTIRRQDYERSCWGRAR